MKGCHHMFEGFLPLKLLGRIFGMDGVRPAAIQFPAAVMFIDVSRYTGLVEQLARRGQEGLEEIPRLLNLSYARCAEYVSDRRGEVLCLAGDSLLAYWPADRDEVGSAVRSAVACAEMICRNGNDGEDRTISEISPALHVGIGAGHLWAAALGGEPVWNLVAGGEAIMQAAAAQAIAPGWSYVMSAEAAQALTDKSAAARVDSQPAFEVSSDLPSLDWLAGFLPTQVREFLLAPDQGPYAVRGSLGIDVDSAHQIGARCAALNEIRPVSAVFARIVGLNCRDPHALSKHQVLCVSLQEILRERGGPPGELFYGDKGLVFSAAFGARGNFHRDDPRRAVDAARAINLAVERLGLSSSVGVATGDALFGFVGSSRLRQLMVHGAPMNRAARLMTADSRGILCDAPTARACRAAFRFEERGALQLAGLGDMAAVFCPAEPHATASFATFLIGRRSELEVLRRAFDEAQGGKCLLVVMGESGIGKSALVTAFADELCSTATTVCVARAERDDRRTSLLPWRRVLASLLGLSSDVEGALVLNALAARVTNDPTIVGRLPLLDCVLGIENS